MSSVPPCREYTEFEKYLRDSRKIDDNIILLLNKTDGTKDQCEHLYQRLGEIHKERNNAIKNCIKELEDEKDQTMVDKHKVNFLKSELDIEYIVKLQTHKQFRTRCRDFRPEPPKQ